MGKSAPAAPAAPDPYATASAQGTANAGTATAQTALNNANIVSPYGQSNFAVTGSQQITNPDGSTTSVPTYTNTISLSPGQQTLYNQNVGLGIHENNIAAQALNSAGQTLANPLTSGNFSPIQTSTPLQTGYSQGPSLAYGYDSGGNVLSGYDQGGAIQKSVNYSDAPTQFGQTQNTIQGSLGNTDFSADRDAATQAVLQRLAPTIASQGEALRSQLANQGVAQNSSAYNGAQLAQAQQNNDLYLGAINTGDQEQQALYGQKLSSGQFQNAAQQQEYDQLLGRGQFAQAGVNQNNAAALAAGNFANAAQLQGYGENAATAAFANSAQAQRNAQNQAAAGFYNTTIGQQNTQNAAQAGFYNEANLAGNQFANQAQQQQYTEGLGLQNQVINQIGALRSGGQVATPNFPGYSAGTLDQTPLSSDVYATAGLNQQAYNTQAQLDAANNSAFASTLGSLGKLGVKSDRRLKRDIQCLCRARNGLPIYLYRMIDHDGWVLGFMADEVALLRPEATWIAEDGFARVDYELAVA